MTRSKPFDDEEVERLIAVDSWVNDCIRVRTLLAGGSAAIAARLEGATCPEPEGSTTGPTEGEDSGAMTLFCAKESGEGACIPRTTDEV